MTREEAIKICTREKDCVQGALDACADGGHYVSPDGIITALDYVEALDMAIAALREQESAENAHCNSCKKCNSWISVEEKLPEDWVWVQVYRSANKTMDTDFCTPSRKGGWCHYNDITHWMPLPEPPEVEV